MDVCARDASYVSDAFLLHTNSFQEHLNNLLIKSLMHRGCNISLGGSQKLIGLKLFFMMLSLAACHFLMGLVLNGPSSSYSALFQNDEWEIQSHYVCQQQYLF